MNNKNELQKQTDNNLVEITDKTGVETGVEKVLLQNVALLPKNIAIDKIKASAGFYISNREDLMKMNRDGKLQMLYGVLKEAMLGCEAGTDYDIILFKGKPTIIRNKEGYFKIIDMIKPAEITRFVSNVITKEDEFYFNPVTEELTHELKGERYQEFNNILGSYAYIKFANGFEKTVFLDKKDLEKIKDVSPSGKSDYSPWNSQSLKMVKTKTVKELAKELCTLWSNKINSILANAINSDEMPVNRIDSKGYIENDKTIFDIEPIEPQEDKTEEIQKPKQVNINDL